MTLTENATTITVKEKPITENFSFILDHFGGPLFPRTIMTKAIDYQKEVFSEQEALAHFKVANFQDCRINAYPTFMGYKSINFTPVSFIMIDLDLKDLNYSQEKLDIVLSTTLNKIADKLHDAKPNVLWTGNGYHIYQPVNGFVFEEIDRFAQFIDPNKKDLTSRFMQFAEYYFTDKKSDPQHRPSIKSCLIRIPGTANSKCNQKVKIVQRWNGIRAPINYILRDFRNSLVSEKIKDKQEEKRSHFKHMDWNNKYKGRANTILWTEKLLQTPLNDHRKYAVWRIFVPYLFNIRKLSDNEVVSTLESWLYKCSTVRPLDFNSQNLIKQNIRNRNKNHYLPINTHKLRFDNIELYKIICGINK